MDPCDSVRTGVAGGIRALCAEDTLMILRCDGCGRVFAPLTAWCSKCASSVLEQVPSGGVGSILSWRVVGRAGYCGDDDPEPLTIAIVELDEGPWVYAAIEGGVPLLPVGPVRVRFTPRRREDHFPVFAVTGDRWASCSA
ncbi:hypothetical protein NRB56_74700 [Nocardia sp. RB56]|uniref:DUF35 domain-containing protein n=2 Tax=Nocardia aurantia TaxID=2585199 RepID=A0A7K0E1B7_9NOCA|nr:hypothetical protein [Nocardia aurantia]